MQRGGTALLCRRWFGIVVLVSGILTLVTFASYALQGSGGLSRLLFLIGLGGENNVGAWWSGMLLLLAAVFAFDGYANAGKHQAERHGWLALAGVLLILSFDEVASLHEYLANSGLSYIAPFGAILFALTCFALAQLYRGGAGARTVAMILLGFALFATIPLHEYVQQTREWSNPLTQGVRAALEEGTEILAMLVLVAVLRRNSAALLAGRSSEVLAAAARLRTPTVVAAAVSIPVMVAATFVLPYPGGPADWTAAALYFACALLVARELALGRRPAAQGALAVLLLCYLAASVASNAVALEWDPVIFGTPVSVRGLFVTLLLLAAPAVLRWTGRDASAAGFGAAALAALAASLWPQSQILWCLVPPVVALGIYVVESRAAALGETRLGVTRPVVARPGH